MRVVDLRAVRAALARGRGRGRRGASRLRAALADAATTPTLTRSELEERFLVLCRAAALPRPEVNVAIALADGEYVEADFPWRARGLVVETDGHATHGTRQAFERDRRRDQRLQLAGYRVLRFTWRQVNDDGDGVIATVRALLGGPPYAAATTASKATSRAARSAS